MTLSAILCFIALTLVSEALFIPRPPVDWTRKAVTKQINTLTKFSSLAVIGAAQRAHAAQGAIKPSTIEETKMAVNAIQEVLDSVQSVDGLVEKKDFDVVAAMFATKAFSEFANNCQTLVRSDAISADDKVALGTIKRYGVVADAIIMIGGIGAELKAGGLQVAGTASANSIEDEGSDEEEEENAPKRVNAGEVKRYAKLAAGSLEDILRIGNPVLKK